MAATGIVKKVTRTSMIPKGFARADDLQANHVGEARRQAAARAGDAGDLEPAAGRQPQLLVRAHTRRARLELRGRDHDGERDREEKEPPHAGEPRAGRVQRREIRERDATAATMRGAGAPGGRRRLGGGRVVDGRGGHGSNIAAREARVNRRSPMRSAGADAISHSPRARTWYHCGRMADEPTDETLMAAYCAGDDAAFEALFARYGAVLFRVARRHLETEDQAREVAQEVFVRVHAARHDFRQGARFRPWVMTITMNLCREYWRKKKRRKTHSDDTLDRREAPAAERGPIETRQRAELLRSALEALPESQRVVVELHWFQDLPFAEVAKIVGSSEGAVRVRAHRAYKTMKARLAPHLDPNAS